MKAILIALVAALSVQVSAANIKNKVSAVICTYNFMQEDEFALQGERSSKSRPLMIEIIGENKKLRLKKADSGLFGNATIEASNGKDKLVIRIPIFGRSTIIYNGRNMKTNNCGINYFEEDLDY